MHEPRNEEELAEAIRSADGSLRIRGGGTRPIGNPVTGEVLSTGGLTGIELYEPGALTIVAKSGTPLAEIEANLAAENQILPFEPMDHRGLFGTDGEPTIGAVVAANVSGPRRIQAGACRDSLIGVRFVDGTGTAVKNGGRVMKNVTGYDLVKLFAGSFGTLGVLTEVSFKVLPKPDTRAVVLIDGLDNAQAQRAMSVALASPYEVSGAAHTPKGIDDEPVTMLRIEGFETSTRYRSQQLRELLKDFGPIRIETDPDNTAAGWRWVRDASPFHGTEGDIWRISVKPTDGPSAAEVAGGDVLFDWGGGLVWAQVAPGTDLRSRLHGLKGHATLVRAGEDTRSRLGAFPPEAGPVASLSTQLRKKFDPRSILNPGLMENVL
jgi:glycolate oxidase FAD binding subunit